MLIKIAYDTYVRAEDILYVIANYSAGTAEFTFKAGDVLKVTIEKYDVLDDGDSSYIEDYMEAIADLINNKS